MTQAGSSNYRWYVLSLAMMTYFFIAGAARLCMPVLFKEIAADLDLSLVAIGTIWGMDPLAGVFIGLPGGLIADRFGVRRTLIVVCFMSGLFGALRGVSFNFASMAVIMFFFGLMAATMPSVVPKTTAVWFSGKQLGLTNALLNVAWAVGGMSATMFSATILSPLLGGWRNVLFLFAVPCILVSILWWIIGREPARHEIPGQTASSVPFKRAFLHVVRMKKIWIIGIIALTGWGSSMGLIGYLPLYLRNIGWAPASADSAITVLTAVSVIGSIPVVLMSDKLGSRKAVLMLAIILMSVTQCLLPFTDGPGVFLLLIINGFMRSGAFALYYIMIFETKGVGSAYSGTAIGLSNSLGMFGSFFAPPVGNSLTAFSPGMPYLFWGLLSALALPLFIFLKEGSEGNDER